jgi:hypothetical protein
VPATLGITYGVLSVTGVWALIIGGHDLLFAGDLQPEISGALLLGAGLVIVFAVATFHRAEYRSLRLFSCGFGALIFVLLFTTQLISRNPSWLLAVWLTGLCAEAACLWAVWTSVPRWRRRLPLRRVGLAALGTVAALLQFWWVSIYTPARVPSDVSVSLTLSKVAAHTHNHGKLTFLEGKITISNTSGSFARVAGSMYVARRFNLTPQPRKAVGFRHLEPSPPEAQRYASAGPSTVIAEGPLIRPGHYLDVGQEATIPITIAVSKSRFAVVRIVASVAVAREPLKFAPSPIHAANGGSVLAVADNSWLHRLTRGQRYLRVIYDTSGNRPLSSAISRYPDRVDSAGYEQAMSHVYGLTSYSSSGAVMLPG